MLNCRSAPKAKLQGRDSSDRPKSRKAAKKKERKQASGTSPPEASTPKRTASPGVGKGSSKTKSGEGWSTVSHKQPYANRVRKKLEYSSRKSWEDKPYFDEKTHALDEDWLHFDRVLIHHSVKLSKFEKKCGKKEPPLTVFGTRLAVARSNHMNNGAQASFRGLCQLEVSL